MPDLLFEIGAEEIPAGYIRPALAALKDAFVKEMAGQRLSGCEVRTAGTPRRLVLHAAGLPGKQADVRTEVSGPARKAAFDAEGRPTKAAEGFARKLGIAVSAIQFRQTPKGEYCTAVRNEEGRPTIDILRDVLPALVTRMPFPKSMYWCTPSLRFARPIRSLLALFGEQVVPLEIHGIQSGRVTWGHPFLSPGPVELRDARFTVYQDELRKRHVIVDPEERRRIVQQQVEAIFARYGSKPGHPELMDEVTNLVEWPHALEGRFADEFLAVPAEVIETAMMEHQRYFPVRDSGRRLLSRFVLVSNRDQSHEDTVREGNERVLRARLSDARFFWDEDRKMRLADRVEILKSIVYQEKLGTYFDRTQRVVAMASFLAQEISLPADRRQQLDRAAWLCKADLTTDMVYEFPSLQGVMGREYAQHDGEAQDVAAAIEEHYLPRQAGGELPRSELGTLLALADKVDTVVACFAAGLAPTASQDPYALRRQTLGILRILVEKRISLSLGRMLACGYRLLPSELQSGPPAIPGILEFTRDRLYHFCVDRGYRYDLILSVLDTGFDDVVDFMARLDAISALAQSPQWDRLYEVVERTYNITRVQSPQGELREDLLAQDEERRVFAAYQSHRTAILDLFAQRDYLRGGQLYSEKFADVVHEFFDKVFVNVDDPALRNNRLLLMQRVHELFASHLANLVHGHDRPEGR